MEREFEESLPPELRNDSEPHEGSDVASPALVCWRDDASTITLTHVSQQGWLLACSLGLLIPGLGLSWAARPRPGVTERMASWYWPLLALLTLVAALAALFYPTMFWAIVYGSEPGVVALIVVLAFQWMLHRRYRRQIVFLPSFNRGRPGSSLLRKSTPQRSQNSEPSTVDAPPGVAD
jgi:hypothetical protein